MSTANIGYDTRFAIEDAPGSGVYVELVEVYEVTPPEISVDQIDVTHFRSPGRAKEYIPALSDNGTAQATMNFVPNSATDQRLETLRAAATVLSMRITYPSGVTVTFDGFVATYSKGIPVNEKMTAQAGFKVAGAVTIGAAAAPANTVLPAISGTVQVGQTLTAFEGVWTNSPVYTYQWQVDDTGFENISGATGKTYIPVAGDATKALRVIVTGTNSAGSASATSAATVAVAAA